MEGRLGSEWPAFQAALQQSPLTTVRLHPIKGQGLFSEAPFVEWHPLGRILPTRPSFEQDPLWHAGAYYVQEASGMSLRAFLPARRPLRIIDLSAAPGGKSTLLLGEIGREGGLLIANDPDPHRRGALRENLARWGTPAYVITGHHPSWWAERFPGAFDVVVLDAPCSGEGLWRRDPRAMSQWSLPHIQRLQRLQRSLLFAAQRLVAPQGVLIYATCTFSPEENEENLAYAFRDTQEWVPLWWESPPSAVSPVEYGTGGLGYYFYPHRGPGEGFFVSAWQKKGIPPRLRQNSSGWRAPRPPSALPFPLQAIEKEGTLWGLTPTAAALFPPTLLKERWESFPLYQYSRPSHALALLEGGVGNAFPSQELSLATFPAYLRGELFSYQHPIEWVTYAGRGIGWLYKGKPSLPFFWKRFLRRR
jgi:16S rRNA C967 or C1407 C5-methylase (RsmB/RsmF family)